MKYLHVDVENCDIRTDSDITLDPWQVFSKHPLVWAVTQLLSSEQRPVVGSNKEFFLDFIDDITMTGERDLEDIDQNLSDMLSDLAPMLSIQRALEYHRPVVPAIDTETSVSLHRHRSGGTSAWRDCTRTCEYYTDKQYESMARAFEKFAKEGWPKGRKDRDWLLQADRCRANLQHFWDVYAEITLLSLKRAGHSEQRLQYKTRLLQFSRTPEHLDEVDEERQAILTPKTAKLEPVLHTWNDTIALVDKPRKSKVVVDKRVKRKHTSIAAPAVDSSPSDQSLPEVIGPVSPQQIEISTQNIRLFKSMFGLEPAASKWQHFVAGMVDAGCSALQSSGSAVTFKNEHGSIVFHKPHPEPIINPIMLQSIGKRLKKWFKWDKDVFVERVK